MNNARHAIITFLVTRIHAALYWLHSQRLCTDLWQAGCDLHCLHTTAPVATRKNRVRLANRWQRVLSIMLCLVLLSHHLMAAPPTLLIMANHTQASLSFWWHSSGWAAKATAWWPQQTKANDAKGWDGKGAPPNTPPDPKEQEKQSERDARVFKIEISPRDVTINTGEKVIFAAVAYDRNGNMIPGVKFTWDGSDEEKARKMSVTPRGEFSSPVAGKYKVTVEALGKKDSVKVIVVGEQVNPKDKGMQGDSVSSHDAPKAVKIGRLNAVPQSPKEATPLRKDAADKLAQLTNKSTRAATTAVAAVQGGTYDFYQWNTSNYTTADDPQSEVGQMSGHAVDGGAGSGNFQFSAPLFGLDGRGVNVSLGLFYNARLWHKSGTDMYFNIDNDDIAGWTFGFGKIITAGSGFMLIDADGTRHSYGGNTWNYSAPNTSLQGFDGYTKDGSFINYYARGYKPQFNSTILEAWAKLPNGTKITYGASTKLTAYPTNITDANGNYITITYLNNQGPNIDTITDTLGRQIKCKYVWFNGQNVMAAVTAPGFNGGADRVIAQFAYDTINLAANGTNYGFSGVTPRVQNSTITVRKAIYYPATNTGFWFGDPDSYSKYGMIRKISERRAMVCANPNDTTAQANITSAGNMSRELVYSSGTLPGYSTYGTNGNGSLTDVPTYTSITEDWAGRQAGIPKPVTEYSVVTTSTTTTTKITRRDENTTDGFTSVQITDNNTASQTYGLVLEDYTLSGKNVAYTSALSKSKVYWEVPDLNAYPSHYGTARPNHREVTDERGQMTSTYYSYGINYNQVADVKEYGYNNLFLRRTHTDYINTQAYIGYWYNNPYGSYFGRHIYSLPSAVSMYTSEFDDSQRVARTEYQYDQQSGQALVDTPNVPQHWNASNPYSPVYQNCSWQWNYDTDHWEYMCDPPYTEYDASTDARGNITSVKSYANAQNYTSDTLALVETRNYDICGNVRIASTSCCAQTSFDYNSTTAYAWPSSAISGSASDPNQQNTSSTVYDFNTGLVSSSTDANGRTSTRSYNATTLRPVAEYSPTGGYAYHEYYDDLMAVIDFVYEAGMNGGNWANRVDKYLDGEGRVSEKISFTLIANNYDMDVVNTVYDQFGRVQKVTRPYRRYANWVNAETPQWTNYTYDIQSRVTTVVAPDGSTSYRYYNESSYPSAASSATAQGTTLRVKDAWGRERWIRNDDQNRLVEVVEPDPNGTSGAVATNGMLTTYTYNSLGNLTNVTQGTQTRSFKYDSLGRMTNQKLAERDGKLADDGTVVATGAPWSDYFQYDNRGNITQRIDARGVKTNFNYNNDPLNRLYQISYDKSAAINATSIVDAPTVTYKYFTTGDKTRSANVELGTPNNAITEFGEQSFGYDAEGRLNSTTQSYGNSRNATTSYHMDSLNRVDKVYYPAQNGQVGSPIRLGEVSYDIASRVQQLKYNSAVLANNPVYNASGQTLQLNFGNTTQEQNTFDAQTGLLTNQKVVQGATEHLNLSYDYTQAANGTQKTGQLTKIIDNKNTARNRTYTYDKLGRLRQVAGGVNGTLWNQMYTYDRFGNRTGITQTGTTGAGGAVIPMDGLGAMIYDAATNRITSTNFAYDAAGNQTQSNESGLVNNYKYDTAGRLVEVINSYGTHTYQYGAGNQRLQLTEAGGATTLYAWDGGSVIAEYNGAGSGQVWTKSYVYLNGGRLVATETPVTTSTTQVNYHHPDRLGTRLVTNTSGSVVSENIGLPFGCTISGESNNLAGSDNLKRFTSYDRSNKTTLDYALSRQYSAAQGRFTQVDPIANDLLSLSDPQSLNLYAYCGNDPNNNTDPSGLFSWKKLFGFFRKAVVIGLIAAVIIGAVLFGGGVIAIKLGVEAGGWFGSAFLNFMGVVSSALGMASPSVVFSLATVGSSAAAWGGLGIWSAVAMAGVGAANSFAQAKSSSATQKKKTPCAERIVNAAWDIFKADQAKAGLSWEDRYKEIKEASKRPFPDDHPTNRANDGLYPRSDGFGGQAGVKKTVYVHGVGYSSNVYCNIFVHDTLNKAGLNHPHYGNGHPVDARGWKTNAKMPGFERVTDGSMQRGDIVSSGIHMGIQTDTVGTTGVNDVMASSSSANGEVKPYTTILGGDYTRWRCKD